MATKPKPAEEKDAPKAKQQHLAGMEPPSHAAIDVKAERYYDLIAKSYKLRATCDEAKADLLAVMEEYKLTYYTFDDKEVNVEDKITVKVKRKKEEE